jgi:hypothetical protein
MRRPSHDYEHGNLEAARIIVAEPWKAQGSAWLLEWARRTVARHDLCREPARKGKLHLLPEQKGRPFSETASAQTSAVEGTLSIRRCLGR